MSTGKEGNKDIILHPTDSERNCDIHTLSAVNTKLDGIDDMYYVLTGSYAIEALTQQRFRHGDIDSNIFTKDIFEAKRRAVKIFEGLVLSEGILEPYREAESSLWYMLKPNDRHLTPKRLELQFVEYRLTQDSPAVFSLEGPEDKFFRVPTTIVSLKDSDNRSFDFRVKSLSYLIASWALRISGMAEDQKRAVVASDLDNLGYLLRVGYEYNEVIEAIRSHPQMPKNSSEALIFKNALAAVFGK